MMYTYLICVYTSFMNLLFSSFDLSLVWRGRDWTTATVREYSLFVIWYNHNMVVKSNVKLCPSPSSFTSVYCDFRQSDFNNTLQKKMEDTEHLIVSKVQMEIRQVYTTLTYQYLSMQQTVCLTVNII